MSTFKKYIRPINVYNWAQYFTELGVKMKVFNLKIILSTLPHIPDNLYKKMHLAIRVHKYSEKVPENANVN